jgi:hypothetical protein
MKAPSGPVRAVWRDACRQIAGFQLSTEAGTDVSILE